mmetsp:Transcript_91790/g.239307  ORF Transcript_91790/g.239307 Transcript_91790/m.239307 type:complete len:407 (+) Transcript_91790:252-1472(+)
MGARTAALAPGSAHRVRIARERPLWQLKTVLLLRVDPRVAALLLLHPPPGAPLAGPEADQAAGEHGRRAEQRGPDAGAPPREGGRGKRGVLRGARGAKVALELPQAGAGARQCPLLLRQQRRHRARVLHPGGGPVLVGVAEHLQPEGRVADRGNLVGGGLGEVEEAVVVAHDEHACELPPLIHDPPLDVLRHLGEVCARGHRRSHLLDHLTLHLLHLRIDVLLRHVVVRQLHPIGHKVEGPPRVPGTAALEAELLHGALAVQIGLKVATCGEHRAEEGDVHGRRGRVRREPGRRLLDVALGHLGVTRARDRVGARELPADLRLADAALEPVRALEGSSKSSERQVELGALIVRAEPIHHVTVANLLVHGHREREAARVVRGGDAERGRGEAEHAPHPERGVHRDRR